MTTVRTMTELQTVDMAEWSKAELRKQHDLFSDLSPWLNSQGVSIHQQIIKEIEKRGGI